MGALALITWIGMTIGRTAGRFLLYPITLYFLLTAPRATRGSFLFLRRLTGGEPQWLDVFRHIYCFAATILDRVFLLAGRFEQFDIRVHDAAIILDQVASGRGCILLGSHLGSFEMLRVLGVSWRRFPLKVLMNVDHNPGITKFVASLNREIADTIIPFRGPGTILQVMELLEQGYLIGMLGDRVVSEKRVVTCRFFGREAPFPSGPMLLAVKSGAPVVLVFALYHGGNRYDLHFERLSDGAVVERDFRSRDVVQCWMQRYAERLEHYTRIAPDNWFNFFDFWGEEGRGVNRSAHAESGTAALPAEGKPAQPIGADGFATLLLSNLLILLSAGISLSWPTWRVYRVARSTRATEPRLELAVVLGYRLREDGIAGDYARRLERAHGLHVQGHVERILILGGGTGAAEISEAEAGRRYLISRGVPEERLIIEENSIHTLENLRNLRTVLDARCRSCRSPFVLITSRYHLARAEVMARGLGLRPVLCAAEDRLAHDPGTVLRMLREGWFLHWYSVGRTWSRLTGNHKSLARIS